MNDLVTGYSAGLIVVIGGLTAFAASHLIARLAIAAQLLPDRPNARSSHAQVTPRSGGVAIIGGWCAGMLLAAGFAGETLTLSMTFAVGALVLAAFLLGLADDLMNLRAYQKFLGQVALAAAFVVLFGGLEAAPVPFIGAVELGYAGPLITVFWVVAFMNAFNFMDGVNGIAAACGAFALAALAAAAGFGEAAFWAMTAAFGAAALLAFLPLNSPKGRLFMGDNGSQAIGFLIAASAVGAANASSNAVSPLFVPVVMLPFLFDVAFTLAHRTARGSDILEAHREHLYQICARLGLSHAAVTALFLSLTAACGAGALLMLRVPAAAQWLMPLALSAALLPAGIGLFRRAQRHGLIARSEPPAALTAPADHLGELAVEARRRHAAE
jgi:UDP-GlcNAc:undecaprenyl-phosphate GlcNAc-1-phosphate transferase